MVGMVVLLLLKESLTVLTGSQLDAGAREAAALKVAA